MHSGDPDSLKDLFERASALPADEQQAFLEHACRDDPDRQAELESLIAAAQEAEGFFDSLADAVVSLSPWSDDSPTGLSETALGADPLLGRTVRHYRIEERLGSGGMGVVYRAHDTRLNRAVALKFLPRHLRADDAATERFLVEARAAAALDHPNVCVVHEIGEDEKDRVFISMACYEGETLRHKIERGPLAIEEAWDYARQIAAGLGAAHAHDIVHRDVKPGNVIITPEGVAKVLDFGLAKLTDVTLTRTGTTLGTVAYMSPEQVRGTDVDHRTDLWSLGVVLYEMLTGERPFKGDSTAVVLHAIQNEDPEPPSTLRPEVPPELEAIVGQLLAKNPAQRPAGVEDAGLVTGEATLPRGVFAKPGSPWARVLSWPVAAALVMVAAVLAVWSFVWGPTPNEPASELPVATVAVFPFDNLSGEAALDRVGEAVVFGIVDGLSWMDEAQVVGRDAVRDALRSSGQGAGAREIAADLGAGTSVTGVVMSLGDSLHLRAQVTSVATGEVQHAVDASGLSADERVIIEELKQRVMGAVAMMVSDEPSTRYLLTAPTYEAFQAFARGQERFDASDHQGALERYREAYRLDTTFVSALNGMATAYANLWQPELLDSVVTLLESRRSELHPIEQHYNDQRRARLEGDRMRSVEAVRATFQLDPGPHAGWLIVEAVHAGRPEEALQVWEESDEGQTPSFDSPSPWYRVVTAQHMTGRYQEQLATARRARELFSERPRFRFQEIQGLVALGRLDEAGGLVDELESIERPAEADQVAERAVSWYRAQDSESYRLGMVEALLLSDRPEEAERLIRVVLTEYPEGLEAHALLGNALARTGDPAGAEGEARWLEELDRPYLGGANTYSRAAIAAHLGQRDLAVRLLRQAIQEGVSFEFLHYEPVFAPLWGYEPFEQVIAPRG
jgi:serine/threonine protein kinase/TolB-like protein